MDPFAPFQDEFINEDNTFVWDSFSPTEKGLSDMLMVLESPTEPQAATTSNCSAFVRYDASNNSRITECVVGGEGRNINKRVIEMLGKIPRSEEGNGGAETSRGFRHMMRERQRREKLSQSYADLYSLISTRSKSDKNSIVQSATIYVRELKEVKDALQKRNEELKKQVLGRSDNEASEIKVRVANPSSSIDSLIGALRCLKSMDVKARAIKSEVSSNEFSAIMSIDAKIAADEVERRVEIALMEIEKNVHFKCPEINIQF